MLWHARMNLVNNYNPIDPLDTTFNTGAGLLAVQKAIESGLGLTRFDGRLTRPSFGAEVAHEIEQDGGAA
jgi:hypothetical protein